MLESNWMRAMFTPESRYYGLFSSSKGLQNIDFFFLPDITLSVFVYGVRTGRDGRPFLSLVPGLLPVSSFISALPKMQPWSRA